MSQELSRIRKTMAMNQTKVQKLADYVGAVTEEYSKLLSGLFETEEKSIGIHTGSIASPKVEIQAAHTADPEKFALNVTFISGQMKFFLFAVTGPLPWPSPEWVRDQVKTKLASQLVDSESPLMCALVTLDQEQEFQKGWTKPSNVIQIAKEMPR